MDTTAISELLQPFLPAPLAPEQLGQISTYIDLLLLWNLRVNLTAIREPEPIVVRHFGESLFTARHLYPSGEESAAGFNLTDLGSGAGFPGLPIRIWEHRANLTLVESNHKKATFLREAARALTLTNVNVLSARAETLPPAQADVVTLRAVERFTEALPTAARLLAPAGCLALLIGQAQATVAKALLPGFEWQVPIPIPRSSNRILLLAHKPR